MIVPPLPPYQNHQGGCRAPAAAQFLTWCCLDHVSAQSKACYHPMRKRRKKNHLKKLPKAFIWLLVGLCTTYMTCATEIVRIEAAMTCLLCMHWVITCGEDHVWDCHNFLPGLTVICDDWWIQRPADKSEPWSAKWREMLDLLYRIPHRMHEFHRWRIWRWHNKSRAKFLLQHLPGQPSIWQIYNDVLVPLFWDIRRGIIHEDNDRDSVDHPTICLCMQRVRHDVTIFSWHVWEDNDYQN